MRDVAARLFARLVVDAAYGTSPGNAPTLPEHMKALASFAWSAAEEFEAEGKRRKSLEVQRASSLAGGLVFTCVAYEPIKAGDPVFLPKDSRDMNGRHLSRPVRRPGEQTAFVATMDYRISDVYRLVLNEDGTLSEVSNADA